MRKLFSIIICAVVLSSATSGFAQDSATISRRSIELFLDEFNVPTVDAIEDLTAVTILTIGDLPDSRNPDGKGIDDKSLEKLSRFPNVRTLTLSCPKLTDQGLKHVAKLKNLECLIVYWSAITDEGLQELKPLSKLEVVGLLDTRVTDDGVTKLKSTLKETFFEVSPHGKYGSVFDSNGCIRPKFVKKYLQVQRPSDN